MASSIFTGDRYAPPNGHESHQAVSIKDLYSNKTVIERMVIQFPSLQINVCDARLACLMQGTKEEAAGSDARCLTTIFHHLRRLKRDGTRWRQACRRLGTLPVHVAIIRGILDKVAVEWSHDPDSLCHVPKKTVGIAAGTEGAGKTAVKEPAGFAAVKTEAAVAVSSVTAQSSAGSTADKPEASSVKHEGVDRLLEIYGTLASRRGGAKGPRQLCR